MIKFVVAYAVLTWCVWQYGDVLLHPLLPLFRAELQWLAPELRVLDVTLAASPRGHLVTLAAEVQPYAVIASSIVPPGVGFTATTQAGFALQHVLLLYSALLAWPALVLRERAVLCVLALPVLVIVELLDIPFMLWGGATDLLLHRYAPEQANAAFAVVWMRMLDGGGRAVLSLVAIALLLTLRRHIPFMKRC